MVGWVYREGGVPTMVGRVGIYTRLDLPYTPVSLLVSLPPWFKAGFHTFGEKVKRRLRTFPERINHF